MKEIRSFWIEANIDGRQSPLRGGPTGKVGGFCMAIYQRDKGRVTTAARISGFAEEDGTLHLTIRVKDGDSLPIIATVETGR